MIGKIINNYIIDRKLGGGGMGDVYYAKHNKVDREVAIKVLHSHLFSNESIHNRFKNEANALIKLNHPNIVKIFDYVEQDNFACLIMEYINGYTLDDYISQITGPLPSAKASSIICSILDAVQYAHDNNVYHRDIKPANIMISKEGNKVRIMDFGIAKLTDSKNFKTTHANTQLGTPFYMSPEQIKGLPYSRMSDIYSLGVTLFEMVTGKCPYHQITSLYELQSKIVNEPLPHTSDYYPGVSLRIQNSIIKATQKTPELRFQSCSEFKMYLQDNAALNLTTIVVKPQSVNQLKGNSNWLVYLIAGLGVLILIILGIVYLPKNTGNEKGNGNDTIITIPDDTNSTSERPEIPDITLIQKKNDTILNAFLTEKKKTKIHSQKKLNEFITEIRGMDHIVSSEEINTKYNTHFPPQPSIEPINLDTDQVKIDLCSVLGPFPKGIPFEDNDQISEVNYTPRSISTVNPPNEIRITVSYKITSKDDASDSEYGSQTLKYSKSGKIYRLIR